MKVVFEFQTLQAIKNHFRMGYFLKLNLKIQIERCLPPCNDFTYEVSRIEKLETTPEMSASNIQG